MRKIVMHNRLIIIILCNLVICLINIELRLKVTFALHHSLKNNVITYLA